MAFCKRVCWAGPSASAQPSTLPPAVRSLRRNHVRAQKSVGRSFFFVSFRSISGTGVELGTEMAVGTIVGMGSGVAMGGTVAVTVGGAGLAGVSVGPAARVCAIAV